MNFFIDCTSLLNEIQKNCYTPSKTKVSNFLVFLPWNRSLYFFVISPNRHFASLQKKSKFFIISQNRNPSTLHKKSKIWLYSTKTETSKIFYIHLKIVWIIKGEYSCFRKTLSMLLTQCHATSEVARYCFLIHQYYLLDTKTCRWLPGDLPRVLQIWQSVFYPLVFLTSHSFLHFEIPLGPAF